MVKLRVIYGCNSTAVKGITLHEFPKDVERCRQWVQFVQRTRVWESKPRTSHICSKHFCKEAISNYLQVEMGVAKRLVSTKDAVPTIYPSIESIEQQLTIHSHLAVILFHPLVQNHPHLLTNHRPLQAQTYMAVLGLDNY